MTNMLERTSWSRHRKPYGFNKYVKNYELKPVAAEVWLGLCACSFLCMTWNLVWVPRDVCLAVFTEFVGHPLHFHGPVEQNELLATGNRPYLSRQSHVLPLCLLISVTLSLLKQLFTFLNIEVAERIEFRNCWVQRQEVKMWHTSTVYPFLYQIFLCSEVFWGIFTLLTLKKLKRLWDNLSFSPS